VRDCKKWEFSELLNWIFNKKFHPQLQKEAKRSKKVKQRREQSAMIKWRAINLNYAVHLSRAFEVVAAAILDVGRVQRHIAALE
jgi:hypothetical protein